MSIAQVFAGVRPWALESGSCLALRKGLTTLPDLAVDHAIFDPPYSSHVHEHSVSGSAKKRTMSFACLSDETRNAVAKEMKRLVKRWVLVFSDMENAHLWRRSLVRAGLEYVRQGTWVKSNPTPQVSGDRPAAGCEAIVIAHQARESGKLRWNGGGRPATWTFSVVSENSPGQIRIHDTQKPMELMEALVRDFTDKGELILDPFAGSATTLAAAVKLGRRAVGWEYSRSMWKRAKGRLDGTREQLALFEGVAP